MKNTAWGREEGKDREVQVRSHGVPFQITANT